MDPNPSFLPVEVPPKFCWPKPYTLNPKPETLNPKPEKQVVNDAVFSPDGQKVHQLREVPLG